MLSLLLVGCMLAQAEVSDVGLLQQAAQSFQEALRAENAATRRDLFRSSAGQMATLRRRGYSSAALDRNEGNAALLAGDLPQAILAYRRGCRRAPTDIALREGLVFARAMVNRSSEGIFFKFAEQMSLWCGSWSGVLVAAVCHLAAWLALGCWLRCASRTWLVTAIALFGWTVFWVGDLIYVYRGGAEKLGDEIAVVAKENTTLHTGNGFSYAPRLSEPLHVGQEVECRYERNGWLQVQTAQGEIGWIPASAVLKDEPSSKEQKER